MTNETYRNSGFPDKQGRGAEPAERTMSHPFTRRLFLMGGTALAATAAGLSESQAQTPDYQPAGENAEEEKPFSFEDVIEQARIRSEHDFNLRKMTLGPPFADLDYDAYRAIRFKEDRRLWSGQGWERPFSADFFAPGFLYSRPVKMFAVSQGRASEIAFDASAFDYHPDYFSFPAGLPAQVNEGHAWTGFRLRYPLNRPNVDDEVAVFHGASYFRAIARDLIYGLSARGLAIGVGSPNGEEFPAFTDFWLVEPEHAASQITLYALLDSPSVSGAFEFKIEPGSDTEMDVRSVLFPRVDVADIGIASLTSMYFFGPKDRVGIDDYRAAVHDSQGLQMLTGKGEALWRPVTNPAQLEFSTFQDENPKGFGLVQRSRRFDQFEDAEAQYERRPSAWVVPKGDWGKGGVMLVEIPTTSEFNDNIVAFWRPEDPLKAGQRYEYGYRILWAALPPEQAPLAQTEMTRAGRSVNDEGRFSLVLDFDLGQQALDGLKVDASSSVGSFHDIHLLPLQREGYGRVSLSFEPPQTDEKPEMRVRLVDAQDRPVSETWLYRWGVR